MFLQLTALAAEPWSGPACWDRAEELSFGVSLEGVPHPIGLPIYLEGQVVQPRFYEHGGVTFLGDTNQLMAYNPAIDQFDVLYKGSGGTGVFAFAGGSWLWIRGGEPNELPLDASDRANTDPRALSLIEVGLNAAQSSVLEHALDVRDPANPDDPRWARPVALLGGSPRGSTQRAFLVIELQPTEEQQNQSVVHQIELNEGRASITARWVLDGIYDHYNLAAQAVDGQDVLLMVSHSDKLLGLVLREPADTPASPVTLTVDDLTALADPDPVDGRTLIFAQESACVAWNQLTLDAGVLTQRPLHSWCPNAGDSAPFTPDADRVRGLSALPDGRVFVSSGPDRLRSTPERPRVSGYFLPPPEATGWGAGPLPVTLRESISAPDRDGSGWHLVTVYGDSAGRIWATATRQMDARTRIQRLDMPFQPLDAALGMTVEETVPFDGRLAVLARAPDGALGLLAVAPQPIDVQSIAAYPATAKVYLAAGASGLWALVTGPSAPELWRWRAVGATAELVSLPTLDATPTGFWLDEGRLRLRFGEAEGAVWRGYTLGPDDHATPDDTRGPACSPPTRLPSIHGDALICEQRSGEATTWTRGEDRVAIPLASGGWAFQEPGSDGALQLRIVGKPTERRTLRFPRNAAGTPLLIAEDRSGVPWLYTLKGHRIERQSPSGAPEPILQRGPPREQRDLPPSCRPLFERAARGALELGVDGSSALWLTLRDAAGGPPLTLLGPVLPFEPTLRASLNPLAPFRITIPEGEPTDPRLTLTSSCAPGRTWPLTRRAAISPGWVLEPARDCELTVRNNHGLAVTSTRRFYSATGVALATGGVLAVLAVGGVGILRWLGRRRAEVKRFAEQAKNPYVVGPPVRGAMFHGRERLLDELVRSVQEGGFFGLVADEKRIGKTSLLLKLQERLAEPLPGGTVCRAIYFSMERSVGGKMFFQELWRALARVAREQGVLEDMPYAAPANEHEAFANFSQLLDSLHQQDARCVIVLLLDEIQMLAGADVDFDARDAAQKLRSLTAEPSRDRLSWVAAGVKGMLKRRHKDTDSDLLLLGPRYGLGNLEEDAALRLLRDPIAHLPVAFSPEAEAEILRYCRGHPFVIQYTCRTLFTNASLDLVGGGQIQRTIIGVEEVLRFTGDNPVGHLLEADAPEA